MIGSARTGLGSVPTAAGGREGGGGTGDVESVTGTAPITVDNADPANPVVGIQAGVVSFLSVRALADSNITLSGAQTIDGVAVVAGDRVLVNGQTAPAQNGIYVAAAGAWSRATDFDAAAEMVAGKRVAVTEGTLYAASLWQFATTGAIVVGTTALAWALIGPSFGPDTRVPLPNAAGNLVTALRLLTTLTTNTPGAEASEIDLQGLYAGVLVNFLRVVGPALYVPDNVVFLGDTNTGIVWNGADSFALYCGGQQICAISSAGFTLNAGIGAGINWGVGAGSIAYSSGNGRLSLKGAAAQGNVELGLTGLAASSNFGFASIPGGAGPPTGTPTSSSGMVPLWVDTTNAKLYGYYGGAWHDLTKT